MIPIKIFAIDALRGVAYFRAITDSLRRGFLRSSSYRYECALSVLGRFRNDVNHAIDGICAPQRCPRAANDFDAVNVFEHDVLNIPVDAGEERCINAAPINQNQQLIVESSVEPA